MAQATETEDARIADVQARLAALKAEAAKDDASTLATLIAQATALAEAAAQLEAGAGRLIIKATERGQALGPHMTNAVRAAKNVGMVLAALKAEADAAVQAEG